MPEFQPMALGVAARNLGIEPFEVVRLLAASGVSRPSIELTPSQCEELRAFAGIERWWENAAMPSDEVPLRGVLRGALRHLLDRKHIGDARTRQDNLWRGLASKQRRFLEDAIDVLVEHGLVGVRADVTGVLLSIRPEAVDRVAAIADGRDIPDDLARLWS